MGINCHPAQCSQKCMCSHGMGLHSGSIGAMDPTAAHPCFACCLAIQVARQSLISAKTRLRRAKRRRLDPDEDEAGECKEALALARTIANQSSEIGDERPIMACAFRPDGQQLATAAWSGLFKLWQMPLCQRSLTVRAHQDRITGVRMHGLVLRRRKHALHLLQPPVCVWG